MKNNKSWQRILLIPFGILAVALLLYKFDPLQIRLQENAVTYSSAEKAQKRTTFDPFYVKGFKQVDGQYFIVILDGVSPNQCPCSDPKVRSGRKSNCPLVHHREKKAIIEKGRKLGLPEYNFPVLEICD